MHLNLFAGYELDYFLSQIQLSPITLIGGTAAVNPDPSADVSFRGLTAGASLRF